MSKVTFTVLFKLEDEEVTSYDEAAAFELAKAGEEVERMSLRDRRIAFLQQSIQKGYDEHGLFDGNFLITSVMESTESDVAAPRRTFKELVDMIWRRDASTYGEEGPEAADAYRDGTFVPESSPTKALYVAAGLAHEVNEAHALLREVVNLKLCEVHEQNLDDCPLPTDLYNRICRLLNGGK